MEGTCQPGPGAVAVSSNEPKPRFDESLPAFVDAIFSSLGKPALLSGSVLRDASGRLTFISNTELTESQREAATHAATHRAPGYCVEGRVVLWSGQPGVAAVLKGARSYRELLQGPGAPFELQVFDQRIVGQDWLEAPAPARPTAEPRRYVFASIKGGVGRTTALAVVAADMAHRGKKVLVVDLDLEAPGIGSMLIPQEDLPRFGLLDALVENGLGGINRDFLFDMIAASPFGRGRGLVDVVPALGSMAQQHPANVLAKISRGYLEDQDPMSGQPVSFMGQTQRLVDELAALKHYDAVLLDARAGLNESTATAILGLGAQVLLFGEDTPQTFAGYRYLLAHLARYPRDDADDWLDRIRMVHAKASADPLHQQAFRDRAHEIFQELLYRDVPLQAPDELSDPGDPVTLPEFSLDDPDAPHFAWPVLRDSNYFEFDPLADPAQLTPALYDRTYQALLAGVKAERDPVVTAAASS